MILNKTGAFVRRRASDLTEADSLLLEDGSQTQVTRISPLPAGPVLQISLAGPHHVYLTDGLWSHNKGIPQWPPWN